MLGYSNTSSKILDLVNENYGDSNDYSTAIEKAFKQWWKTNADLGNRILKGDLDVEVEYTDDKFEKPCGYEATMNSAFVDVEDYIDEIGKYIEGKIPAIKYESFDYDEDTEDITWKFSQNTSIPDFGDNIF